MAQDIKTRRDLVESLRDGKYSWPGGYPKFWLTNDGETLSYEGVRANLKTALVNITDGSSDRIVAVGANWENPSMYCAHTGERIESAYAEDKVDDGKPRYAYGNGMPGCLFDNSCGPYTSIREAADAAADFLELTDEEREELTADGIIYFRGDRFHEVGAGMVSIFEVDADWASE